MEQENMQSADTQTEIQSAQADNQSPQTENNRPQQTQPGAYPFRGAAFGGFQRQDVLDYLKKLQLEQEQALLALRGELDAARAQCGAAEAQAAMLAPSEETANPRVEELEAELENARETLAEKSDALETLAAAAAGCAEREAALQAELEAIRPQAEAYQRLKDRAATIELDAHERAQITLDRAKQESERIRERYVEWVREIHGEYQELREDINLTLQKASQELERLCKNLERTAQEFDIHEEELQAFLEQTEQEN